MKDISCEIIEDLIPLVEDGIASHESQELVREHIEDCKSCRDLISWGEDPHSQDSSSQQDGLEDERIIRTIKRKLALSQILLLVFGTVIGVALTYTIGMFYNIALMPLLGGLSYIFLRERWYLTPMAIILSSYLWQIGQAIILGYFASSILYGALIMTGIYGGLSLLGVLIGFLLKFAFGKGDDSYEKE